MRDPRAGGGDSFYAQPGGRPVFNPGNTRPSSVPRTGAVPRRVGRNPVTTLVTWAAVLVVGAIGVRYGYPVVMDRVQAKEISAVTADLSTVAAGEASYAELNGTYGSDFASLGIPRTISRVDVVSATGSGFCLKGTGVTGGVVRYYSPGRGVTEHPCG